MPKKKKQIITEEKPKVHIWRLCPIGEHPVRTHPMHVPPSKTNPDGSITTRHWHCAKYPSGKDQLYPLEIEEVSNKHFPETKNKPCPINLDFQDIGNKYDDLTSGWTQYWNEVMKPATPLAPNTVKALIGSESGFNPSGLANKKDKNSARGLMQINNQARKILSDEKGELKNHYVTATREELNDPNINICTGIRWLFQKQKLASSSLGREATWDEAVENYKGLKNKSALDKKRLMKHFYEYKEKLEKCAK